MQYKNIVLIDDDEDDTSLFIEAIEELSDSIIYETFFDATEALKKLVAKEIRPDVIFLDLNMPKMNGQQFLIAIKEITTLKDIPIIIYSTTSHPATMQLTKELGGHDFITKPRKFEDLITLLRPFFSFYYGIIF